MLQRQPDNEGRRHGPRVGHVPNGDIDHLNAEQGVRGYLCAVLLATHYRNFGCRAGVQEREAAAPRYRLLLLRPSLLNLVPSSSGKYTSSCEFCSRESFRADGRLFSRPLAGYLAPPWLLRGALDAESGIPGGNAR